MPRRTRTALAALTLAALVSACGSTVQVQGSAAVGQDAESLGSSQQPADGGVPVTGATTGASTGALAGTTGALSGGTSGTSGTTGSTVGTTGGGATGSATTGGASGTSGVPSPGPSGPVPPTGRGWNRSTVYIGVVTQNDAQKAFAAFGATNVDPGDTNAQAKAMAADINARGGILGRKVELVFKDVATVATATNPDSTGSQVCAFFTQDHPVIAVMSIVTVLDYPNFRACLAKGKTPLFSAAVKAVDDKAAQSLSPFFYQTVAVSWDALAPVLVSRLKAQGYFGGWDARLGRAGTGKAKVGVLVDGTDIGSRIGQVLKSTLAQAGYPDTIVFQYAQASDGQGASVQKFSGSGVTHVIVTDVELTAFQNSAASQQYKPRYGIHTYNAPYTNLEASGLTPAGANNGAIGVGWVPAMDVSNANEPAPLAGAKSCARIMAKGGQSFSGKRLAQTIAYSICDSMLLMEKGAVASNGFNGAALLAGIVKVGPTYQPANGFSPGLTARKLFVPGAARDLTWVSSCSCMRYGSGSARL